MLETGATVRCQAPLIKGVNDAAETWAELWTREVRAGAIPYYMFVERDTGARRYFEVPLARALDVYRGAIRTASGLAGTARGPVMSATAGKVQIDGLVTTDHGQAFVLKLIRARNSGLTNRIELAAFDSAATWLDDLSRDGEPGVMPFSQPARAGDLPASEPELLDSLAG